MKKSTIFIIFLALAMLKTQAQNYLISFAGAGESTMVSTVKVDNLTSGATVTLNGGDVLHLIPAVGIGTLDIDNVTLHIYPNPMAEQSMLTFTAPENGNAVLCIVNLSGKTVYQISTMLSTGVYSFRVSGINRGMYFVKVTGKNYNYSTKLISQSNLQGEARIEYVSSVKNTTSNQLKSAAATIDMPYTDGDQLLYKGISGIYSTIVPDVPTSSKTITFNFVACTDNDGNNYATVQIGTGKSGVPTWMAENLNVGVRVNNYQNQTNNGIIEKYCFNDLDTNCNVYGGLYQWNEMMQYVTTSGAQGICPSGWHIPTDTDLATLTGFLGGESVAGGKMKETGTTHWISPNTGATNSNGFTALPGGSYNDPNYYDLRFTANFWSSTVYDVTMAWYRYIYFNYEHVTQTVQGQGFGFSVRCLKD